MDNTDNLAALKAATIGAQQLQAANNPGNPLGATAGPELTTANASKVNVLPAAASAVAQGNQAQLQVAAQKAQQAALQDGSKYTRVKAPDGGYNFFDPTGKPISAQQYAAINNTTEDKVLSGSTNPIDLGYIQDYNNLQAYLNAKINSKNSPQDLKIAQQIEQAVSKQTGGKVNLATTNIQDVINQFQTAYPTVYGLQQKGIPTGQTFIPARQTGSVASQIVSAFNPGG